MKIQFNILCTLGITHEYYEGGCPDFDIVIPDACSQLLRNGKMIAKTLDGILNILFEADDANNPIKNMSGCILRFGLKLNNPAFTNFTSLNFDPNQGSKVYNNESIPGLLAPGNTVSVSGNLISHKISQNSRPVSLSLQNRVGNQVGERIDITDTRLSVDFDITRQEPGPYDVREDYGGGSTQTIHYYMDGMFASSGILLIAEIKIDSNFYSSPAALTITFTASSAALNYYVVARKYTEAELALLHVVDAGFGDDPRPPINFTKIASADFEATELPIEYYATTDDKVFLFRSTTPVKRRLRPRKKLQLMKNGTALIENLLNPTADKNTTDLIIKISKP